MRRRDVHCIERNILESVESKGGPAVLCATQLSPRQRLTMGSRVPGVQHPISGAALAPLASAAPSLHAQRRFMATDKIKVLYIAGNGRSGSTLLGVLLGQIPGFFNVGEVRRVWDEYNS